MVRLAGGSATIPAGDTVTWAQHREGRTRIGTLARGDDRIVVRLGPRHRPTWEVSTTGSWPEQELLILTVCFALHSKRRRDRILMASAGTH